MSAEPLHRTFPVNGPVRLNARVDVGRVEITAEDRNDAVVEIVPLDDSKATAGAIERARVELVGDELIVDLPEKWFGKSGRVGVTIAVPTRSAVTIKVATADVVIQGTIGHLDVSTATGDVRVGPVDGDAKVTSASADVRIGAITGAVEVKTASGDVQIEAAATARLQTASGDVKVGRLEGDAQARTASGDIEIGEAGIGTIDLNTVSGDVGVRVPSGRLVWLDLSSVSGRTDSDLVAEDTPDDAPVVTVRARSVSGGILVGRAI